MNSSILESRNSRWRVRSKNKFKFLNAHNEKEIQSHFIKIWEGKEANIKDYSISFDKLNAHLNKRYSPKTAGIISNGIGFKNVMKTMNKSRFNFNDFKEILVDFLNLPRSEKLKMLFQIFDLDSDSIISMRDILKYTNNLDEKDRYLKNDALKISKYLENKFNPASILRLPNLK